MQGPILLSVHLSFLLFKLYRQWWLFCAHPVTTFFHARFFLQTGIKMNRIIKHTYSIAFTLQTFSYKKYHLTLWAPFLIFGVPFHSPYSMIWNRAQSVDCSKDDMCWVYMHGFVCMQSFLAHFTHTTRFWQDSECRKRCNTQESNSLIHCVLTLQVQLFSVVVQTTPFQILVCQLLSCIWAKVFSILNPGHLHLRTTIWWIL